MWKISGGRLVNELMGFESPQVWLSVLRRRLGDATGTIRLKQLLVDAIQNVLALNGALPRAPEQHALHTALLLAKIEFEKNEQTLRAEAIEAGIAVQSADDENEIVSAWDDSVEKLKGLLLKAAAVVNETHACEDSWSVIHVSNEVEVGALRRRCF